MESPLFYTPCINDGLLPEQEAYHAAKVLRARPGMSIMVTDGKGTLGQAVLTEVSFKRVCFQPSELLPVSPRPYKVRIAVAPTRKPERNEWMLEKLVEIGVDEILFIKTVHTHLESFGRVVNQERMEKIAISAMKQSGQFFLPGISIGISLNELLEQPRDAVGFIAYVPEKATAPHLAKASPGVADTLVLIGPEGDFSKEEVQAALDSGFGMVSLGSTRLRTETAAIAACHAVHLGHL
ncbi:MAG: hypothetical protein ABS46_15985 [Cytophagaceae bacterium SCN 52-12]|nr:MAG: hypothetical protein ABS46_15985 [Cytophagaceae bacterium SCN 52-12]